MRNIRDERAVEKCVILDRVNNSKRKNGAKSKRPPVPPPPHRTPTQPPYVSGSLILAGKNEIPGWLAAGNFCSSAACCGICGNHFAGSVSEERACNYIVLRASLKEKTITHLNAHAAGFLRKFKTPDLESQKEQPAVKNMYKMLLLSTWRISKWSIKQHN